MCENNITLINTRCGSDSAGNNDVVCVLSVYFEGHRAEPLTGLPDVRQKGGPAMKKGRFISWKFLFYEVFTNQNKRKRVAILLLFSSSSLFSRPLRVKLQQKWQRYLVKGQR
jgi:hypothetical protein